jgi:excisionase family DNA binding protein
MNRSNSPAPLESAEAIALRLGVSARTVRHWARRGQLKGIRVGKLWRFNPLDLPVAQGRSESTTEVRDLREVARDPAGFGFSARQAIRELQDLGWSQKQIAFECQVTQWQISRCLSGQRPITPRLSALLGETVKRARYNKVHAIIETLHPTLVTVFGDIPVDDDLAGQTKDAVLDGLADPEVALPSGVRAAVLALAGGTFLLKIAANRDADTIQGMLRTLGRLLENRPIP